MADKTDTPKDEELDELEVDEEAPWDDDVDPFVNELDAIVMKKYGVSLRKLLINPRDYTSNADVLNNSKGIKDEIESYFDGLMNDLQLESDELTKSMEEADALYTKVDQIISSKATVARVPCIKPVDVEFGDKNQPEVISISQFDNSIDSLISKFINMSNYIGNLSTQYKTYNLGQWLFSGERDYVIKVDQPESMVITVENAKDYIDDAIDETLNLLSGAAAAK